MPRSVFRLVLAFVLGLALSTPWAALAQPQAPVPVIPAALPGPAGLLAQAWALLSQLWTETGCELDPDGDCLGTASQPAPPVQGEEGCGLDPNGLCIR